MLDLDVALQNTYRACINIDENLHELKVLAGINTAVTAVGTAAGAGATITGLVKSDIDKRIETLFGEFQIHKAFFAVFIGSWWPFGVVLYGGV